MTGWWCRAAAGLTGTAALAVALLTGPFGGSHPAIARAATVGVASVLSRSEPLTRTHLVAGQDQVVDQRTFTAQVSTLTGLRDRQEIDVSWSGAHPTGGLIGDQNSAAAAEQEYPVVVMECRGVDSPSAPAASRVSPSSCWTHTPRERFQSDYNFNYPAFRMDRYAVQEDRRALVGQPVPFPAACAGSNIGIQHWVPFVAANGTVYGGGSDGCAGLPPEAANAEASLQPSNTTYGASDLNGNGTIKFVVSTDETNASLGCSASVACSLVIIPIEGISCDAAGTASGPDLGMPPADRPPASILNLVFPRCSGTGHYQAGQPSPGFAGQEDLAVSGTLWWTASNWNHRISLPMSFAPPANVCSVLNTSAPTFVYGSEVMAQATGQWAPRFCLDPKLFRFQHVQASEPEAKNLLEAGSIEAAFEAGPPQAPFTRPVVQAPAAVSGFAVAYDIDDATGHPYHDLKLTPRLLAKLLTESYPANSTVKAEYAALNGNPLNLAADPEFRALNPGMPTFLLYSEPAATLFAMSSDSDVMTALTSYIDADPEARAWLDGKPDPWGMVVNPAYKAITLPVASWPLRDTFEPAGLYRPEGNACLAISPVPFLPLVAAPVSAIATITLNMQFSVANSQIQCVNPGQQNQKLAALGRENPGQRFLLGITTLADAERYQLDSAALQAQVSSSAPTKFTSAAGRSFVAPTEASLRVAAGLLTADAASRTWVLRYPALRTDPAGAGAYPGALLLSMAVPTSHLPSADAQHYAQLLRFVAGEGQAPGLGNGQLPPGYLPMTSANGLAAQVAYTLAAADAVAAQAGTVPVLLPGQPGAGGPPAPQPGSGGAGQGTGSGIGGGQVPSLPSFPAAGAHPGAPSQRQQGAAPAGGKGRPPGRPSSHALGKTAGVRTGPAALAFPLLLLAALLGALVATLTGIVGRSRPTS